MTLPLWMKRMRARIEAGTNGYLPQIGWIETRAQFRALDTKGAAIPWFTYPAVRFLADRTRSEWRVLEFGAGMGTIWWSERTAQVTSLEHHAEWLEYVAGACSANVISTHGNDAASYVGPAIGTGKYDLVIVDGLYRPQCLAAASNLLTTTGVIILDDAQRAEYAAAIDSALNEGFRILEFHGPQPVSKHPGCTAVLYRRENVLGI